MFISPFIVGYYPLPPLKKGGGANYFKKIRLFLRKHAGELMYVTNFVRIRFTQLTRIGLL